MSHVVQVRGAKRTKGTLEKKCSLRLWMSQKNNRNIYYHAGKGRKETPNNITKAVV